MHLSSTSSPRRLATPLLWLVPLLAISLGVEARAENSYLQQAREAAANLDHHEVAPLLERALEVASGPEEEAEIYQLLAVTHTRFGREAEARHAYIELLRRQPAYQLPTESSPKLREIFAQARIERGVLPRPSTGAGVGALETTTGDDTSADEQDEQGESDEMTSEQASTDEQEQVAAAESTSLQILWVFVGATGGVLVAISVGVIAAALLSRPVPPDTDLGPYPL